MRLTAINCIFLACATAALASEPRQRRHLHQIKEMISNKLFGCKKSNFIKSQPSQPEVKFFKIPGFNNVVIKAVPKGSTVELPPIYENIPPNSHIGIIGSYLGTSNLNDTYNALQGVRNLLQSGILGANNGALDDLTLLQPSKIVTAESIAVKPRLTPGFSSPPPPELIRVIVKPPNGPERLPTQYSYKQVNQDGSLTSYTSSLHINKGMKVTDEGKTIPFFIDRIRKIPVQLPVPLLPENTKIFYSNPYDTFGRYPLEPIHHGSSYNSYLQVHPDGKLTTHTDLPLLNGKYDGPVIVSETGKEIPSPPVLSRNPFLNNFHPNPATTDVPVPGEQVIYNPPLFLSRLLAPEQGGYPYTPIHQDGGKTTAHSVPLDFNDFTKNPAVSVTKYGPSAPTLNQFPRFPEMNRLRPPTPDSSDSSYNQDHADGEMTSLTGSGVQEYAGVNSTTPGPIELRPLPDSGFQTQKIPIPPGHHPVFESPIYIAPFPINVNPNAVKPSTPASGSYKLVQDGQVNNHAGVEPIHGHQKHFSPQGISCDQPFAVPPSMPIPAPVHGCVDREITPNVVLFQEPVPLSYTYKQISHSHPNSFLVVKVEDPVRGIKKVNMKLSQNNQAYQQYHNAANADLKYNGYVYVPPSNDNIPASPVSKPTAPQTSFSSYKQATNQYSDELSTSRDKTNESQIMFGPQNTPAGNMYAEQTSNMPSNAQSISSYPNSLTNNPIVIPEQTSFSSKQTNVDGSPISVMDNPNSMAVDVEQAPRPESVQVQESPRFETAQVDETLSSSMQVNEASRPSVLVSEAPNPEHVQESQKVTSGKPIRRRKIKRVKHRGDIPEDN